MIRLDTTSLKVLLLLTLSSATVFARAPRVANATSMNVPVIQTPVTLPLNTQAAPASGTLTASRSLWLSATPTGGTGTGTQSNPIDVSTAEKFDAFWTAQYNAHSSQSSDSALFTLLPGQYYTHTGIGVLPGWKINGSGQNSTIIQGAGPLWYYSSDMKSPAILSMISEPKLWAENCAVENLTLDGNTLGFSTPLAAGFTMPAPRASVTVSVTNTTNLAVGKWVYVQDTAMNNDQQQWWGIMTVTAINGNQVTLQNSEIPNSGTVTGDAVAGSPIVTNISSTANLDQNQSISSSSFPGSTTITAVTSSNQLLMSANATTTGPVTINYSSYFTNNGTGAVPATAHLFPYVPQTGIEGLSGPNITIESVTVQDVSVPIYEGGVGIWLNQVAPSLSSGDVIDHCTVQNVFGIYGWCIMFSSNNWGQTPATLAINNCYIQGAVTNNVIIGNGHNQGIGMAGVTNTTFSGNNVTNCGNPFWCDTGYNTNVTITHNVFAGYQPMHVAAGGFFKNSTISDNTLTIPTSYTYCLMLSGNDSDITVTGNTFNVSGPLTDHEWAIVIQNLGSGCGGMSVTNNVIQSYFSNEANPAEGIESGNVDQNGNLVLVGLQNLN